MYIMCLRWIIASTFLVLGNTESDWKLDSINDPNCEEKCFGIRRRYCEDDVPCLDGPITENFSLCPYPGVCPADQYVYGNIVKRCIGICDLATETIAVECIGDNECTFIEQRFCVDHSTCTGNWGSWQELLPCCNGFEKRERRCMLDPTSSTGTKLCLGGKGRTQQIEEIPCSNSKPCNETNTLPSEGRTNVINCANQCQNNLENTNLNSILDKCGHKDKNQNICNSTSRYAMSCGHDVNTRECSMIKDNEFACDELLEWSDWGEWEPDGNLQENRYRYQWCGEAVSAFSNYGNCRRVVVIDKQCREQANTSGGIPIWSIIIIALLLFLIVLLLLCFLIGKKRSKSKVKNKTMELPPPIEMREMGTKDENSEDVFVDNLPPPPPMSDLPQPTRTKFLSSLAVVDRLSTASEHFYEKINSRKSRIFSRSSSGSSTHPVSPKYKKSNVPTYLQPNEGTKQVNEYTLSLDDAPDKKESKRGIMRPNHKSKQDHLRISVTITDPDGIEVGKNVYKASSQLAHTSRSNNLQISEKKKQRWSRVPSPKPKKNSDDEFFGREKQMQRDYENQERTDDPLPPPPGAIQTDEVKIMNGKMKNIFRIFGKQKPKKIVHKYDDVPADEESSLPENKPRIFITSAKSSCYEEDDRSSQWSDSTFDDIDESDNDYPPLPEVVNTHRSLGIKNPKSTNRKKHRRNKSRNGQSYRSSQSKSSSSTISPPIGASAPTFLPTDNGEENTLLRTGGEGMYNYPKNAGLSVEDQQVVGYIDMSPRNSKKDSTLERKNIKSWINLGTPPKPEHSKNNSNGSLNTVPPPSPKPRTPNGQPQQLSTKRVSDLDEKYMASIPTIPVSTNGSLPTDQHGYLHLSFTEH